MTINMELKIKEEYLEFSIGGGKVKQVKLKNLNPYEYEKYYNLGFRDYFTNLNKIDDKVIVIEEDMLLEDIKIEDIEDDIN